MDPRRWGVRSVLFAEGLPRAGQRTAHLPRGGGYAAGNVDPSDTYRVWSVSGTAIAVESLSRTSVEFGSTAVGERSTATRSHSQTATGARSGYFRFYYNNNANYIQAALAGTGAANP
jgi:hypothetical protein